MAVARCLSALALALLVATSTTVIVFLPMILMSGNESLTNDSNVSRAYRRGLRNHADPMTRVSS